MLSWFSLIILGTFYHSAFIFYMQIGIGENKNPIDFGFTRSKVEVTRVTFIKIIVFSAHYVKNCLSHSFHISHADWSWHEHDLY